MESSTALRTFSYFFTLLFLNRGISHASQETAHFFASHSLT